MKKRKSHSLAPTPLGSVEPHASLLTVPSDGHLLYKILSVENLIRSFAGNYLHFSRVDSFGGFPGADLHDGQQLPKDQQINSRVRFEKDPDFSIANYYDQDRARTYAYCLSLEHSDFIWQNYANNGGKGKAGIVFEFGKLREMLNRTLQIGSAALEYNGNRCHQIFSVNYGIVEYVDWHTHQAHPERLPNPTQYVYMKDRRQFSEEREFRISLSAVGIGKFVMADGSIMQFPPHLQLSFDFRAAIANGTVRKILCAPDSACEFLKAELKKFGIVSSKA